VACYLYEPSICLEASDLKLLFQMLQKDSFNPMSSTSENSILDKVVQSLKLEFRPTRLFLYGSRASGNHREDSDFDFVLVVPNFDKNQRHNVMSKISKKFWQELNIEVQVWIYSEEDFNNWKDEFSSIPETALNTGKEIELG